ncbi:MAG TPA: glycoside hydrolase family 3 C-terminal domain-containing protein [Tepidisphaeraceae bacterium]|nr:glycoside hydrolase family 3 C-terminal domain-containing protein [Tepidisphaeraceae bacterium]
MKLIFLVVSLSIAASTFAADPSPIYLDPSCPLEARVDDLLARLMLEEKISLIHGDSKFTTAAIPRLGIPRRWLSDGPHGVREDVGPDTWNPAGRTDDYCTAMPCDLLLASTWDPQDARAFGTVIGQEARARGKQIMLGPSVCIQRTPLCGRNFEYMGEDPFLTSRIAVGYIQGEQAQGVSSCVKHFACNNQEIERNSIDVEIDERPLREIYLPAFEAAVKEAGVLSVMGAYNQLRGQHCCHNDYLLNQILKGEWNFQGLVVSDWGGVHDTKQAVLNGLDLEMGTNKPYDEFYLAQPFIDGLRSGEFPTAVLDDKVRRNLRQMFAGHVFDRDGPPGSLNTKEHQDAARKIAEDGIVLLKNDDGALPLDPAKIKSIAVIGDNAVHKFCHEGGSAELKSLYEITPLDGILHRVGNKVDVTFSEGFEPPPQTRRRRRPTTAASGVEAPQPTTAQLDDAAAAMIERAVRAAKQSDVAIVVAGLNHNWQFDTEGSDRKDMRLPFKQDELIRRVVEANPRTVVVLISGGAVGMSEWIDRVPAIVQAWYPGLEGGNALASVLFGDVNPSGKLPCTFPRQLQDSPAHALGAYPGKDGVERYEEGLLVGYRWFDTKQIEPLFPFGHGLSYTKFEYANLQLHETGTELTVEADITNAGERAGAEIVQVYVQPLHPSVERPAKELKGFAKVSLKPGEKQAATITLPPRAFAYYDPTKKSWVAEAGEYAILVGASSRDVRLRAEYKIPQTIALGN